MAPKKSLFPKRKAVEERVFEKMDESLFFFIFYYQKNQYEQFLAARQLKSRGWLFHTKYMTWFTRLESSRENPNNTSQADLRKGNYRFFDFDSKCWNQKKKNDFHFDSKYLENDI